MKSTLAIRFALNAFKFYLIVLLKLFFSEKKKVGLWVDFFKVNNLKSFAFGNVEVDGVWD